MLKIGELASATSTNVSTIKFYIKEGLIQAACKTGPNMAYYHPDSVARVQLIKSLQKEHYYPLSVIKRMLEQSNPAQSPLDIELLDAIHKVDPAGGSQTFTLQEASRMSRLTRDQIRQLARGRVICPETVGRRQIYAEADLQVMLLIRRRLDAGIPFEESVASFITYQEALRPAASADVDAFISRALMAVRPSAKESVRMICVSDETLDAFIGLKRKEFNREFGSDRVNDLYRYSAAWQPRCRKSALRWRSWALPSLPAAAATRSPPARRRRAVLRRAAQLLDDDQRPDRQPRKLRCHQQPGPQLFHIPEAGRTAGPGSPAALQPPAVLAFACAVVAQLWRGGGAGR